jgi:hypothetical protein
MQRVRQPSVPFGTFIAQYDAAQPITELSGEIWDIDGVANDHTTEAWRVEVLSQNSDILATRLSPEYGDFSLSSLDALPWTFQFRALPPGVAKLRLTFTGTKTSGFGLGFNNFSPTVALPEPATVALAGSAIGSVLALRLFRRRRSKNDLDGA